MEPTLRRQASRPAAVAVTHAAPALSDELDRILSELRAGVPDETAKHHRRVHELSEQMILTGVFEPT
jgi:hypothetical protein